MIRKLLLIGPLTTLFILLAPFGMDAQVVDCCAYAEDNGIQTRFSTIRLRLNGDACHCSPQPCSESTNAQSGNDHQCQDFGSIPLSGQVWVRVTCDQGNGDGDVYYDAPVSIGETYTIRANWDAGNCTGGQCILCTATRIDIYTPNGNDAAPGPDLSNRLQTVTLHTSCSQPVAVGDEYGASEVISTGLGDIDAAEICSNAVLPLELLGFEYAAMGSDDIRFEWQATDIVDFSHFELERRTSISEGFQLMEKVDLEQYPDYRFFSRRYSWPKQTTHYRLKMVDLAGTYEYSKILAVEGRSAEITVAPNPVNNDIVFVDLPEHSDLEVRIYNISGQLLQVTGLSGTGRQELSLPVGLRNQILLIQLHSRYETRTVRILKY